MYYFIYETVNLINGKKYRGYHTTDNLDDGYLGSGRLITKAIQKYGKENFKRTILEFCSSLDEVIDRELYYVDDEWVSNHLTYNLIKGGKYVRQTPESRKRLSETMKRKYAEYKHKVFGYLKGETRVPWNKGKRGLQEAWNKDKKGLQEAWNKGRKGLQEAWNKGKTLNELSDTHKKNISEGLKLAYAEGKRKSQKGQKFPGRKTTNGLAPWNKGKTAELYKCQYCNKEIGGASNFNRWHNDNCKQKP